MDKQKSNSELEDETSKLMEQLMSLSLSDTPAQKSTNLHVILI